VEFLLACIAGLLGVLTVAAAAQVFLLYRLIRELARACAELGVARDSAGRILQDVAVMTGMAATVLSKGKESVSAFCEAADAARTMAFEVKSFVTAILAVGSTLAPGMETPGAKIGGGGDGAGKRPSAAPGAPGESC
jgi:hypothetical protein